MKIECGCEPHNLALESEAEANLEETRGELVKVRAEKQAEIDSLREQFASLEQRLLAMEASMN